MEVVNNLIIGFVASFIGVLIPGLLNLSASKIRIQEGASRAYLFSIGVSLVVIVQTDIGFMFVKYLNKEKDLLILLKCIDVVIFIYFVIYLFIFVTIIC